MPCETTYNKIPMQKYKDFIPCRRCNFGYLFVKKNGIDVAHMCDCLKKYTHSKKLFYKLQRANIPVSVLDYKIERYIGKKSLESVSKIKEYVSFFSSKFHNVHLYLYGTNGTQKTRIAQYIGREILAQDFSVTYVLMNDMIRNLIKQGFQSLENDIELDRIVDSYYTVDCLIVDEAFDKSKVQWYKSDYQMSFLDSLIRKRIDVLNKATIFVSNIPVPQLQVDFNNSIYDLVQRNTLQSQLLFEDHYSQMVNNKVDIWKEYSNG